MLLVSVMLHVADAEAVIPKSAIRIGFIEDAEPLTLRSGGVV
jgi:hypothetical protein